MTYHQVCICSFIIDSLPLSPSLSPSLPPSLSSELQSTSRSYNSVLVERSAVATSLIKVILIIIIIQHYSGLCVHV